MVECDWVPEVSSSFGRGGAGAPIKVNFTVIYIYIYILPRTITSLLDSPTEFVAVSWYSPASCGLTLLIISDGSLIVTPESFPPLPGMSSFCLFFVQNTSWSWGDFSLRNTSQFNLTEWASFRLHAILLIFGRSEITQQFVLNSILCGWKMKPFHSCSTYYRNMLIDEHTSSNFKEKCVTLALSNFIPGDDSIIQAIVKCSFWYY